MRESSRELIRAAPLTAAGIMAPLAFGGALAPHRMAALVHEVAGIGVDVGSVGGCVLAGGVCVIAAHRHSREAVAGWVRRRVHLVGYRARWPEVARTHGLTATTADRRLYPVIAGLTTDTGGVEVLNVIMLEGQSALDYHRCRAGLAAGLRVPQLQVHRGASPDRVSLTLPAASGPGLTTAADPTDIADGDHDGGRDAGRVVFPPVPWGGESIFRPTVVDDEYEGYEGGAA